MDVKIEKVWFEEGKIFILTNMGEERNHFLEVFPSLYYASEDERNNFYLWDDNHSIRWPNIDEDIHVSNFFEEETVNYDNEVNKLLSKYPYLDIKVLAELMGMHWTKLARFRFGVYKTSEETLKKIKATIRKLGKEMSAAVL